MSLLNKSILIQEYIALARYEYGTKRNTNTAYDVTIYLILFKKVNKKLVRKLDLKFNTFQLAFYIRQTSHKLTPKHINKMLTEAHLLFKIYLDIK